MAADSTVTYKLVGQISRIPGAVDVRVQQPLDSPRLNAVVDRTLASQLGITQSQVASSLIGALSGSQQTNPNFWLDPKNGVSYFLNTAILERASAVGTAIAAGETNGGQ